MRAAGVEPVGELVQHRDRPDPRTYVGRGKFEELKGRISGASAESLVVDDELDPSQQRRLEDALELRVVDRTQLILDIFAQHAKSAEGKLQVELAQLEYNLPRMRGLWQHLERLGGGIGTRGPGESQLETDRRLARQRIGAPEAEAALARDAARDAADGSPPRGNAPGRPRRLHERRQVDPPERSHPGDGLGQRPPVRDARPDHPRLRARRAPVPRDRHGGLHPAGCRPSSSRGSRRRSRRRWRPTSCSTWPTPPLPSERLGGADRGGRGDSGRDRCGRAPRRARAEQDRRASTRSGGAGFGTGSPTRSRSLPEPVRGSTGCAHGSPSGSPARFEPVRLLDTAHGRAVSSQSSTISARRSSSGRTCPKASCSSPGSLGRCFRASPAISSPTAGEPVARDKA